MAASGPAQTAPASFAAIQPTAGDLGWSVRRRGLALYTEAPAPARHKMEASRAHSHAALELARRRRRHACRKLAALQHATHATTTGPAHLTTAVWGSAAAGLASPGARIRTTAPAAASGAPRAPSVRVSSAAQRRAVSTNLRGLAASRTGGWALAAADSARIRVLHANPSRAAAGQSTGLSVLLEMATATATSAAESAARI
jgi:hypothetical protein